MFDTLPASARQIERGRLDAAEKHPAEQIRLGRARSTSPGKRRVSQSMIADGIVSAACRGPLRMNLQPTGVACPGSEKVT